MKTRFTLALLFAVVCASLMFAIRSTHAGPFDTTPPLGKNCVVQFRRGDVLGAGAPLPVAPLTGSINGADTSVSGKLKNITSEWIVLDHSGTELWIPKASVLLLQF